MFVLLNVAKFNQKKRSPKDFSLKIVYINNFYTQLYGCKLFLETFIAYVRQRTLIYKMQS